MRIGAGIVHTSKGLMSVGINLFSELRVLNFEACAFWKHSVRSSPGKKPAADRENEIKDKIKSDTCRKRAVK